MVSEREVAQRVPGGIVRHEWFWLHIAVFVVVDALLIGIWMLVLLVRSL